MSFPFGNHPFLLHGMGILPFTQRCQSVSCWPFKVPNFSGHDDWFRDGHMSQAGPIRVFIAILLWALGKRSPLSPSMCKVEGCGARALSEHLTSHVKRTLLKWNQVEASRAKRWSEGTASASSLEHRLYQARLIWSLLEKPPLDWLLVMRATWNQFHLVLTWLELDFCHLAIEKDMPQNAWYVLGN